MKKLLLFLLLIALLFGCSNELPTKPKPIHPPSDTLYVGGEFEYIDTLKVNNIATWDGKNWHALATGITGHDAFIDCMTVYKNELYVGGIIDTAGGIPVNNIAKWNGKKWSAVGEGINGKVNKLVVYKNELYAAGWYSTAGGKRTNNIARWNGNEWLPVGDGFNNEVYTLAIYNNNLYAGGWFSKNNHDSSKFSASKIAKWDGEKWHEVAKSIYNGYGVGSGWIDYLIVYNNKLIVLGNFNTINGKTINRIAQWNDTTWSALSSGIEEDKEYPFTAVEYGRELYIGGNFRSVDSISSLYYAKWDGKEWLPTDFITGIPPTVFFVRNNNLYIGGDFKFANNEYVGGIFKWDRNKISSLGTGVKGGVYAIGVYKK